MSELVEFLYPAPARRTAGGIVRWWERRRLPFNLFVGGAGLLTLSYVELLEIVVWRSPLEPAVLLPIAAFAVGANVCYALGPMIEIAAEELFGRRLLPVGPALYRMGLTFSVGLALLPSLIATFAAVIYLTATLLGIAG
jgi:hypothetical protein